MINVSAYHQRLCVQILVMIACLAHLTHSRPQYTLDTANPSVEGKQLEALRPPMEKRRIVVRLPFSQNPDEQQMSRIMSFLTNPKEKKFMFVNSPMHPAYEY